MFSEKDLQVYRDLLQIYFPVDFEPKNILDRTPEVEAYMETFPELEVSSPYHVVLHNPDVEDMDISHMKQYFKTLVTRDAKSYLKRLSGAYLKIASRLQYCCDKEMQKNSRDKNSSKYDSMSTSDSDDILTNMMPKKQKKSDFKIENCIGTIPIIREYHEALYHINRVKMASFFLNAFFCLFKDLDFTFYKLHEGNGVYSFCTLI